MGNATAVVIDFARSSGGVISRSEALALGMSETTLRRRVTDGVLVRVSPGVYALPGEHDPHLIALHAACRKLAAVVTHQSAAYVHNLDRPNHVKPVVSVQRNTSKEIVGVTVHQLNDITKDQVMRVRGLPVTTPERTIIDLAAVLKEWKLRRIIDHGLASNRLIFSKLDELFATIGRRGKPGTAVLRKILDERSGSFVAPESVLEIELLDLITRYGLPEPIRQFKAPWLRPINGRVDLAYPAHRLLVEGDGRRWHLLAEAFETDRLRDNAAQLAGWRVLRFTWSEIVDHPDRVADSIGRALEDERFSAVSGGRNPGFD